MTPPRGWLAAVAGAVLGLLAWAAFSAVRDQLPVAIRFVFAFTIFTLGPGGAAAGVLLRPLPWLTRATLGAALGVALTPLVVHALGVAHLVPFFPYVAAALTGAVTGEWLTHRPPVDTPRASTLAAVLLVFVALSIGVAAFAHRLTTTRGTVTVSGDYDSYDLTYYAEIASELSHTVPPASPFYSGRMLNHAFYPHVLLAMVHRFGGVPLLDLYFRYAWPAFLALLSLACFVFVERISSPQAAFVSALLFISGSNLAYLAVWLIDRPVWDDVIWSHNFQGAGAEVLLYGNWTPALVAMFAGLYAIAAAKGSKSVGWPVLGGAVIATTVLAKPWVFASVMSAAVVVLVCARRDRHLRRQLALVLVAGAVVGAPLLYRTVTLFDDSQVTFAPAFFPIPLVMADRIGLKDWFLDRAAMFGLSGSMQTGVAAMLAAPLFLVGTLGFRLVGLRQFWQCLTRWRDEDPIWRLLAWTATAAFVASTVIVSIPYHEITQVHQFALFVVTLFAGRAVAALASTRTRLVVGTLVTFVAVPCTLQYLHTKWRDPRVLVQASTAERSAAAILASSDADATVVLHDLPNDPTLLGLMAERRSVLSWAGYVRGSDARRTDVEAFFAGPGAERAREILRAYRPSHVIEYDGRDRINPEIRAQLQLLFQQRGVAIYSVPAELTR